MKKAILTLVFALICAISFAQFQRMGMAKGTYKLSPKGKSSVKAYCQDYSRPAPNSKADYKHVLTNQDDAVIKIGNDAPITLQEAINNGYVSVKGKDFVSSSTNPDVMFNEFINLISGSPGISRNEKREIAELKYEWNFLPAEEKKQVGQLLNMMFEGAGDFRSLSIINHTEKPITIEVRKKTIFGEKKERVWGLNTTDIVEPDDVIAQQKQWKEHTQTRQDILQVLGFHNGELTGEMDEATNMAVHRFKEERDIPLGENSQYEIFDPATEGELEKVVNENLQFFKDFGYYAEEINGDVQKLKATISEFQSVNGLPSTSRIDLNTKAKIAFIARQRSANLYSLGYIDDINFLTTVHFF